LRRSSNSLSEPKNFGALRQRFAEFWRANEGGKLPFHGRRAFETRTWKRLWVATVNRVGFYGQRVRALKEAANRDGVVRAPKPAFKTAEFKRRGWGAELGLRQDLPRRRRGPCCRVASNSPVLGGIGASDQLIDGEAVQHIDVTAS